MIQIRRIYDDVIPIDKDVLAQVQGIFREQFPFMGEETIRKLP